MWADIILLKSLKNSRSSIYISQKRNYLYNVSFSCKRSFSKKSGKYSAKPIQSSAQSRREMTTTARSAERDGIVGAVFAVVFVCLNMSALQVLLSGNSRA